jgi:hypothetical protein
MACQNDCNNPVPGKTERRDYSRTGLNALKAKVKVRGLAAIDKRSAPARALLTWRKELLADLGGEANVTAAKLALVDLIIRQRLYIDHIDGWLMAQPSIINARKRCLLPIVRERNQLADSLARCIGALGVEAREVPYEAKLARIVAATKPTSPSPGGSSVEHSVLQPGCIS